MNVDEAVESILVSLQWDRWRFMLPAKPILNLNLAVVSHGHMDHWHRNFYQKDLVLIPWRVKMPKPYRNLRNILRVYRSERIERLEFQQVDRRVLERLLNYPVDPAPHAYWWIVEKQEIKGDVRVLFIGDMNVRDVNVARDFIRTMFERSLTLHGVLFPSFGGVSSHGSRIPREISMLIRELAYEVKDEYDVMLGALPHPVTAEWADVNAVKI